LYDRADGVFTLLAASGRHAGTLAADQSRTRQFLQQALVTGHPLAIGDAVDRAAAPPALNVAAAASPREQAGRAVLAVPLVGGSFAGGLVLTYDRPRTFTGDDIALAAAFGDQVALAIENAHLRRQVAAAAVADERTRLARDLHDSVTQTLYAIAAIAEALPHVWDRRPQEARHTLDELRRLAQGALAEMRTLLLELRPAALLERPLGDLLHQLTDALLGRTHMPITTTVSGGHPLPAEVQVALYRIAQEALTNSVKHAGASQAGLSCAASRRR